MLNRCAAIVLALVVFAGGLIGFAGDDIADLKQALQDSAEALNRAQAIADGLDKPDDPDPPVDPEPEPPATIPPYPVCIDGQQWTFRTPPPAGLSIKPHPRFLIGGREDEIRAKLSDPAWKGELRKLSGRVELNALRYVLLGDVAAGETAKEQILSIDGVQNERSGGANYTSYLLAYDWTCDLFDAADKEQVLRLLLGEAGLAMPPPGSVEFEVTYHRDTEKGEGFRNWFLNDAHEPHSHAAGFQFRGMVALAFHGDGVRDEWCEYVFRTMLENTDGRIYPIYDARRGGLLDLHNALALNSGGCQAGNHGAVITGYSSMFWTSCPRLMAVWESATGDELFSRDNFYRRAPHWVIYRDQPTGTSESLQSMAMLTGIYKSIDPQTAGLAAWLGQRDGWGKYYEIWVLCLADKTVQPISPYEAKLPLSSWRDGDDRWVSFSDWEEPRTRVRVTSRLIDSNRFEPEMPLLEISSAGELLAVSGQAKKGEEKLIYGSGVMIWRGGTAPADQQGSTYGAAFHLRGIGGAGPPGRADFPFRVMTLPGYRGPKPSQVTAGDGYALVTTDGAFYATDGDYNLAVDQNQRTVVHLLPNAGGREFVVVLDRVRVSDSKIGHCWGMRTVNAAAVDGNRFTVVNEKRSMCGTVLSNFSAIEVRGGPGKITEGPNGESYDKDGGGIFTDVANGRGEFGDWSLYIKPAHQASQDYCVVLEIGETGFVPAAATLSGRVVTVDEWTIDFTVEDQTKVSR